MVRLTKFSRFSGCAAKLGPCVLNRALSGLAQPDYPELMVDYRTADDAGVYKLSDDLALVQTVDFFPPMVDEPFIFGQIAAANALSDIYAMGGTPITALSLVAFPAHTLDPGILREIMEGGLDKLREAHTALVGGHSISDEEIKFGFAVTGTIHPDKVLRNRGARPGDALILTKPLGNGIINTAIRNEQCPDDIREAAVAAMTQLNKVAAELALSRNPSAMTDVTGFGLIGHALEMVQGSEVGLRIRVNDLPLLPGAVELAKAGMVPGGTARNREYVEPSVSGLDCLEPWRSDLLCDPQTSGGLLIAVPAETAADLVREMHNFELDARIIGEVAGNRGRILLLS
jgi:selenide, water dikinase